VSAEARQAFAEHIAREHVTRADIDRDTFGETRG
jgi:hypothetical protein